jgi:hypothetical protein
VTEPQLTSDTSGIADWGAENTLRHRPGKFQRAGHILHELGQAIQYERRYWDPCAH